MSTVYPFMQRAGMIEVGAPRNGRPSYRWVQGWEVVLPAEGKPGGRGVLTSIPMRYREAQALLKEARNLSKESR
jgi:hypothetical protein